jgi:hypothetical protein
MVDGPRVAISSKPVTTTGVDYLYGMKDDEAVVRLDVALTPNVSSTNRFGMQDGGGIFLHESYSSAPTDYVGVALRTQSEFTFTGGAVGTLSTLWNKVTVGSGVTSFVWGAIDILDNSATAGENAARYMQSHKQSGAGPTWASLSELRDYNVSPASGAVTYEFDLWANGADASANRVILDVVAGKLPGGSGVKPTVSYGLRIGPQDNDPNNATISNGVRLNGDITQGIDINSTGTTGIRFTATAAYSIGLNFSLATFSTTPLRFAAEQKIQFEATGSITCGYEASGTKFVVKNGATERFGVNTSSGAISVNGTQVVGPRATGYTAMTGTLNAGAAYDTGTITHQQLAERVGAIQASITNHGLIGA